MISFDYLTLKAFIEEQKDYIESSRIVKIQQPSRTEFLLTLRGQNETKQLYININPQFYHICFVSKESLTRREIKIPKQPPMFCMLLRKYIENSKIISVHQINNERIFEINIKSYNEIGEEIILRLAIELMGKHSNVILYNTDTNIILGCAHNIGSEKSSLREVYGGIPYIYPPEGKNNLTKFKSLIDEFGAGNCKTINDAIDDYYTKITEQTNFKNLKTTLLKKVEKNFKKTMTTLEKINKQLLDNQKCETYRLYGDLLMANLYNLKDYTPKAVVFDYEANTQITIDLNPLKTIKDNANIFYKQYNKLKTAKNKYIELSQYYKEQKNCAEQQLYFLEAAQNTSDLMDIEAEINPKKDIKEKFDKSSIEKIKIDDNTVIYIGKNNKQNDYIVSKLSSDEDLWFHVHNCAGSHVLLKTNSPTEELILKCAQLAKKYSQAKNSTKAGVIYTKRKYLRKPPAAPLGYVTYRNEKEIITE